MIRLPKLICINDLTSVHKVHVSHVINKKARLKKCKKTTMIHLQFAYLKSTQPCCHKIKSNQYICTFKLHLQLSLNVNRMR